MSKIHPIEYVYAPFVVLLGVPILIVFVGYKSVQWMFNGTNDSWSTHVFKEFDE